MKNILVIASAIYPDVGGVETYIANFVDILLRNNYKVTILTINSEEKNKSFIAKENIKLISINTMAYDLEKDRKFISGVIQYFSTLKNNIYQARKTFSKIIDIEKYDYIIDNTNYSFKELRKSNKSVWILHSDIKYLFRKNLRSSWKATLFAKVLRILDIILKGPMSIKNYHNIILPTSFDGQACSKFFKFKDYQKIYYIPLATDYPDHNFAYNNKSDKVVSYCRFDNLTKNLVFMNNVSKLLDNKIEIYGFGKDLEMLKDCDYKGRFVKKDIPYILRDKALFLMTSNTEGFAYSLVESLSCGIPIVVRDTFPAAKYLTDNNRNGALVDKNLSDSEVAEVVKKFLNNKKLLNEKSENARLFFKENLTLERFQEKWLEVLRNK